MRILIEFRSEGREEVERIEELGTEREIQFVLMDALYEFQRRKNMECYRDGGEKQARMEKRCRIAEFIRNNIRRVMVAEVID